MDDLTCVICRYYSIFVAFCEIYDSLQEESDASLLFFDSLAEKAVIIRIEQGCPM